MEQTTKNLKRTSPKKMVFFTLGGIVGLSLTLLAFEWGFYASVKPFASHNYVPATPVEMPPILLPEDEKEPMKSVKTIVAEPEILNLVDKSEDKEPEGIESDKNREGDTATAVGSIIPIDEIEKPDDNEPLMFAEVMPSFGKCAGIKDETAKSECTHRELGLYLQKNISYPERDKNLGFEGIVYIQFVVDENGNVTDPEVKRGVSRNIDAEALRVVKKMPKWSPGKQGLNNVPVLYVLPINFYIK